jgi:hypothetical protein
VGNEMEGTTAWIPLKNLKKSNPIEVVASGTAHKIDQVLMS